MLLSALLRADLIVLVKNRRSLVLSILLPYLILLTTDSKTGTKNLGGPLFAVGLAITYGIASASVMGYSLAVARDREKGVFQRLRVTPAPTWAIMLSRFSVQLLANMLIAIVVVFFGARQHHLSLSVGQYGLVLCISVLCGAMFLGVGQALVALVKSSETVNATARFVYIGLIFLGLFGQSGTLGHTWGDIARWSPVGVAMTLFAGVLDVAAWRGPEFESLLAAVGYTVVLAAIGVRWFQWEVR
jgi:ABC-2 type transport system permease protein